MVTKRLPVMTTGLHWCKDAQLITILRSKGDSQLPPVMCFAYALAPSMSIVAGAVDLRTRFCVSDRPHARTANLPLNDQGNGIPDPSQDRAAAGVRLASM
jgi:hypothetical protein